MMFIFFPLAKPILITYGLLMILLHTPSKLKSLTNYNQGACQFYVTNNFQDFDSCWGFFSGGFDIMIFQ